MYIINKYIYYFVFNLFNFIRSPSRLNKLNNHYTIKLIAKASIKLYYDNNILTRGRIV